MTFLILGQYIFSFNLNNEVWQRLTISRYLFVSIRVCVRVVQWKVSAWFWPCGLSQWVIVTRPDASEGSQVRMLPQKAHASTCPLKAQIWKYIEGYNIKSTRSKSQHVLSRSARSRALVNFHSRKFEGKEKMFILISYSNSYWIKSFRDFNLKLPTLRNSNFNKKFCSRNTILLEYASH